MLHTVYLFSNLIYTTVWGGGGGGVGEEQLPCSFCIDCLLYKKAINLTLNKLNYVIVSSFSLLIIFMIWRASEHIYWFAHLCLINKDYIDLLLLLLPCEVDLLMINF